MRRIAADVGIRAPSLYKHFPDKTALEAAIIAEGLRDFGASVAATIEAAADRVQALGQSYRDFALAHPHLYRLMTEGELPRDRLPPGIEADAARPLLDIFRSSALARSVWAFAHGMTILELDRRFPPDADLEAAWRAGLSAFRMARDETLHLQQSD
jgi:AcrR family transcriptional regulator